MIHIEKWRGYCEGDNSRLLAELSVLTSAIMRKLIESGYSFERADDLIKTCYSFAVKENRKNEKSGSRKRRRKGAAGKRASEAEAEEKVIYRFRCCSEGGTGMEGDK